jgi:hypothetical protein
MKSSKPIPPTLPLPLRVLREWLEKDCNGKCPRCDAGKSRKYWNQFQCCSKFCLTAPPKISKECREREYGCERKLERENQILNAQLNDIEEYGVKEIEAAVKLRQQLATTRVLLNTKKQELAEAKKEISRLKSQNNKLSQKGAKEKNKAIAENKAKANKAEVKTPPKKQRR